MTDSVFADLARDTEPSPISPSVYRVTVPGAWNFRHPSGGVLMTAALRAAVCELADPELRVRSATTIFSSVIEAGDMDVAVRVIRRGGVAVQTHLTLGNAVSGVSGLDVTATFARDRDGQPEFVDVDAPEAPRPEACPPLRSPTPVDDDFRPPIFDNIEVRLAQGVQVWEQGWDVGPARILRWMRYRVPQRLASGVIDPLCVPPLVDTMPPSTIPRLGPGFKPFFAPSLDLTVHFFDATDTEWFLLDTRTRWAGKGYGSADVHVWDERGALLAYATQMWIFRKVPA